MKDLIVIFRITLVIVFILLTWTLGGTLTRNNALRSEIASLKEIITRDSAAVIMYRNDWQRETARSKALLLGNTSLREMIDAGQLTWIRQFGAVNRKLSNLEAAFRAEAEASRSLALATRDTTILASDTTKTVQARKFGYMDEFNTIRGYLAGDTTYLYEVRIGVPLEGAVYWQRRRFLGLRIGRKDYFSDITSPNPWLKVKIEYIKIQKR